MFGESEFYARQVAEAADGFLVVEDTGATNEWRMKLRSALESLAVKEVTSGRSVGRVLASKADRAALIDEERQCWARIRKRMTRDSSLVFKVEVQCGV